MDILRLTLALSIITVATVITGCGTFSSYKPPQNLLPLEQRPQLEPIDRRVFVLDPLEPMVIGEPQIVFAHEEDTFSDLAREYGLGYDELVAANPGINPWLPGDNTPVLLPTQYILPDVPRRGIVLNIATMRLFYFPEEEVDGGQALRVVSYPIGIGRVGWQTPLGETEIVAKTQNPSWYVPASVRKEHAEMGDPLPRIVPPGPDNPLGLFVLKLGMPGYLIHGTNKPYGVGMRVSHGCVRLYPEDIETLYSLADSGEPVHIVNEPYLTGWKNGELYFESHPPLEDDAISSNDRLQDLFEASRKKSGAFKKTYQRELARSIADDARGVPFRLQRGITTDEVLDRVRVVRNTFKSEPEPPKVARIKMPLDSKKVN